MEYIESIMRDVRWLGFDWNEHAGKGVRLFVQGFG